MKGKFLLENMMEQLPRITIVTPVYNSDSYIEKCILSIINQSYKNYEHIIVDGGSTDQTLDIIKKYESKYPLKWISEPDDGMYDAISKGFKMATGSIYSWINADDFYYPWTLEIVARVFIERKIQWLTGIPSNTRQFKNVEVTYLLPNLPTVYNRRMIQKGLYDGRKMYFVQQESCFWTKSLWDKSGGIDKKYKFAGDYYLWKNFAGQADLYTVNCNLASFRIHSNQKSADIEKYYEEIGGKNWGELAKIMLQIYLQLYSLKNYRKYVINILEI